MYYNSTILSILIMSIIVGCQLFPFFLHVLLSNWILTMTSHWLGGSALTEIIKTNYFKKRALPFMNLWKKLECLVNSAYETICLSNWRIEYNKYRRHLTFVLNLGRTHTLHLTNRDIFKLESSRIIQNPMQCKLTFSLTNSIESYFWN